jgi:hypothetical protein
MHALTSTVVAALVRAEEKAPEAEDVVAGWIGFAVFIFLILSVAVIGWSLTRHLRKADRARAEGKFGDPVATDAPGESSGDAATDGS